MKPTEDKYNAALAIGWIEELEEENQRLEDELAKYIGGEANEYGQSQQKIAELEAQNKRYREALEVIPVHLENNRFSIGERIDSAISVAKQALDDTTRGMYECV